MSNGRSQVWRQALAIVTAYAGAGCVGAMLSTRVPGWMAEAGWSAGVIGLALAASRLGRVVLIPVILQAISAHSRIGKGAMAMSVATALSLMLPLLGLGKWGWLGVELIAPALVATLMAQFEWLSSGGAPSRLNPLTYGQRRAAGSGAFAVAAVACGFSVGTNAISTMMAAGVAVMLLVGIAIDIGFGDRLLAEDPSLAAAARAPQAGRTSGLVFAAVMIQASNGLYSLTPILWAQQGHSSIEIGLLWGVAAVSEIGFFLIAPWLCRTIADWPRALLVLGGVGALVRWLIVASATSLPLLIVAQTLQSFSFGASLVGTLALIRSRLAVHEQARAVGINQGLSTGLIPAISLGISGFLLQSIGRQSFFVMAAFALIGTIAVLRTGYRPQQAR